MSTLNDIALRLEVIAQELDKIYFFRTATLIREQVINLRARAVATEVVEAQKRKDSQ